MNRRALLATGLGSAIGLPRLAAAEPERMLHKIEVIPGEFWDQELPTIDKRMVPCHHKPDDTWQVELRQAWPTTDRSQMVYSGWYAFHPEYGEYGHALGSTQPDTETWTRVLADLREWLQDPTRRRRLTETYG